MATTRTATDWRPIARTFLIAHSQADEGQSTFWKYNANNEMYYNNTFNPDQDNPSNTYTTYTYDNNGNQVQAVSYTEHQQGEDGDDNDSDQTWTYDVRGEMVKYVDSKQHQRRRIPTTTPATASKKFTAAQRRPT